jgi:hypothetical protein
MKCQWFKKFDGHYSISCVKETGKRANFNFKKYPFDNFGYQARTKWEFKYCPYCGKEIEVVKIIDE